MYLKISAVSFGICIIPFLLTVFLPDSIPIVDDAYYYIVIAQQVVKSFHSEFFQEVMTNGYHPLWLLLLVIYGLMGVLSPSVVLATNIVLCLFTIMLVLAWLGTKRLLTILSIALLIWYPFQHIAFSGMETALLLFFATLAILLLYSDGGRSTLPVPVFVLALGAAIGARLDFTIFALPLLVLSPRIGCQKKIRIGCYLLIAGALYYLINRWAFGMGLPVSGMVKSLGGMQINERFLRQLSHDSIRSALYAILYLRTISIPVVAFLLLLFVILGFVCPATKFIMPVHRRLSLALLIGITLYLIKILFFSSWPIWFWYDYPVALAFVLVALLIGSKQTHFSHPIFVGVICAILLYLYVDANDEIKEEAGFHRLNKLMVETKYDQLKGKNIAMGDRAGSLSYYLGGGRVFQLEGLTGDRDYFRALQKAQDIRSELCRYGIDMILDYETDLGDYDTHRVPMLRSQLTQYKGAYADVTRSAQVFRFSRLEVFGSGPESGDAYIYAWRLNCSDQ